MYAPVGFEGYDPTQEGEKQSSELFFSTRGWPRHCPSDAGESRRVVADYTWFATILSKIISRPFRRSSFSAKSHACCGYSLVNALMTPALHYQLFSVRACGAGEYHNIFLVLAAWFVRPVVNALTAFRLLYQPFAGICGLYLVCLFILSQTSGNCKTKALLLNCIWVFARNSHFDTVR